MAELINRDDSLNQGRIKLNEGIKASERAENKADEALGKANQSLSQSESTQEQLNQVVINGDSSVEAAQARVNAEGQSFQTLKERLDTKETQTNAQLAQTEQELNDLKNDPLKSRNIYTDYYYPTDNGQTGDIWIVLIDEDNLIPISKEEWEQGSIEGASGDSLDGEIRIRTVQAFDVVPSTDYVFSFENLYNSGVHIQGRVFEYDSAGNFVQSSSSIWVNTPFSLTTASGTNKCKVIFKWTTDATITEEVILNIKPSFRAV